MERVVLIGNCQIQAMTNLYKRFAAKSLSQKLLYVRSYEDIGESDRRAIEAADIVVEHVQDFLPKADIAGIATKAERISVPVVNCGFLWPFGGQPHPQNPRRPYLDSGPYGSESSDAFLNRMVKKGLAPKDAVDEYEKLDVNKMVNLDRLYEITIERQATRDALTGFRIADLITTYFRDEQPFLTPYHPNKRVAVALASQLFEKLGVDSQDIARMQRAIRVTPFPKEELPVHPAVARHFGLKWAGEDRKYSFLAEGRFTFREFSERYVACEWNEGLQEGIELSRSGKYKDAIAMLRPALEKSPGSAPGYGSLAHSLERVGDNEASYAAIVEAVARDPKHPPYRLDLGLRLERRGDIDGADQEIRIAAALDPFDAHYPAMLAGFLSRRGAYLEATAVAWQGLANSPYSASLFLELGGALDGSGDLAGAEVACRQATIWAPDDIRGWLTLSDKLERRGLVSEAADALRQAMSLEPERKPLVIRLAKLLSALGQEREAGEILGHLVKTGAGDPQIVQMLLQAGKLAEAEVMTRRAVERAPDNIQAHRDLSVALERQGRVAEAHAQLKRGLETVPDAVELLIRMGDVLIRERQLAEARDAFARAVAVEPANAHALGQLGHVLSELGQHDDAVAARRRVTELDSGNAHRWAQYAHVLLRAERLDEARAAIETAVELSPQVPQFHENLARILRRLGKRAEALRAIARALALDGAQGRFHAFHAELLMEDEGDWTRAEQAFRDAVRHLPNDAHLLGQFSVFLVRMRRQVEALEVLESAARLDPNNQWIATQLKNLSMPVS